MEEIERHEPRPQSVRILCKHGDEVVVVEEEDTTREMRRLKSALVGVMKQIEVNNVSGVLVFDIRDQNSFNIIVYLQGITWTAKQRHQLIKRMEPLAEENEKLKAAMNLMERNIQRARRE